MTIHTGVISDLVCLGRDWEDGEEIFGEVFYVVAEASDGRRWAHDFARCNRTKRYSVEEGIPYWAHDARAEAAVERVAARIAAHVAAGGKLDPEHWVAIDPAYGSGAYQELDAVGYFRAREREEARDAGEVVPFELEDMVLSVA